jgi:hypothetical protein
MRDSSSLPVFKNMGTAVSDDRRRVTRSYFCKFTNVSKTLVKQAYESRTGGETVRRTSLLTRTPDRPLSTGYHTKEEKQAEAAERDKYCASLSPQERLAGLDRRLGPGVGAKKERARLLAKLTPEVKQNKTQAAATSVVNKVQSTAARAPKMTAEEKAARRMAHTQAVVAQTTRPNVEAKPKASKKQRRNAE